MNEIRLDMSRRILNLLSRRNGRILQIRIDQTFSILTFWSLMADVEEEGKVVGTRSEVGTCY